MLPPAPELPSSSPPSGFSTSGFVAPPLSPGASVSASSCLSATHPPLARAGDWCIVLPRNLRNAGRCLSAVLRHPRMPSFIARCGLSMRGAEHPHPRLPWPRARTGYASPTASTSSTTSEAGSGGSGPQLLTALELLDRLAAPLPPPPPPLFRGTGAVGSRTGAPTLGSGGCSTAFAVARNPATIISFPAPATSNAACELLALRSPVCFAPWVMGPIQLRRLSAGQDAPGNR